MIAARDGKERRETLNTIIASVALVLSSIMLILQFAERAEKKADVLSYEIGGERANTNQVDEYIRIYNHSVGDIYLEYVILRADMGDGLSRKAELYRPRKPEPIHPGEFKEFRMRMNYLTDAERAAERREEYDTFTGRSVVEARTTKGYCAAVQEERPNSANATHLGGAGLLQKQTQEALCRLPNAVSASTAAILSGDRRGCLYAVLPVNAVWIQITGYTGDLNDPGRKPPAPLKAPAVCWAGSGANYVAKPNDGITPCDLLADRNHNSEYPNQHINPIKKGFYESGWLYNRTTAPGVWAGSFSLAPVVTSGGAQTLNEDIRFYGSSKAGVGWLGLNVQFEKGTKLPSNLNSLTSALTYDIHLSYKPLWFATNKLDQSPISQKCLPDRKSYASQGCVLLQNPNSSGIGVRPGEVIFGTGQEYAVTRPKGLNGEHRPKDLNIVEAISYRQPITVTLHKYPSLLTLFPVVGVEGGWHLIRYQDNESAQLFRKVVGADISIRWPFNFASNFISTKGGTIDYSFRARFLSGNEPYTDTGAGTTMLSRQDRTYTRIALNLPFTNYVALTSSVQRGSLPPDFYNVSWTFTVGLSLASIGTAEH